MYRETKYQLDELGHVLAALDACQVCLDSAEIRGPTVVVCRTFEKTPRLEPREIDWLMLVLRSVMAHTKSWEIFATMCASCKVLTCE